MKKTFAAIALLGMCTAAPAFAMDNMSDMDHMKMMGQYYMKKMDTNGDGMISKAEWDAYRQHQFMEADTNHDGMLSMQEVMDMKMKEHQEMAAMKDGMMTAPMKNGMADPMKNGTMNDTTMKRMDK